MLTVAEIIEIAEISQYLAHVDIRNKNIYYGTLDLKLPQKLYAIRKNVEWLYDLDPTNDTLISTANYLYALCAPYSAEAQAIANAGSGGVVVNPATGQPANLGAFNLTFEMGTTSSPVMVNGVNVTLPSAGSNQLTIPLENVVEDSVQVVKDGVVLPINSTLSQYYTISYSPSQIVITLQPLGHTFENPQVWAITGWQTIA